MEGISRSEYSTAPSMTMPKPSASILAYLPNSTFPDSRMSAESVLPSSFVRITFALRGAPCGNDPGLDPVIGGYHHQDSAEIGATDALEPRFLGRVEDVGPSNGEILAKNRPGLLERDAVFAYILGLLVRIPRVLDHAPDGSEGRLPGDYLR